MLKKMCLILVLSGLTNKGFSSAPFYLGFLGQISHLQTNCQISGIDNGDGNFPFTLNANKEGALFSGGALLGKKFSFNDRFFLHTEADALFSNKTYTVLGLTTENTQHPATFLTNENVAVKKTFETGFSVGVGAKVLESTEAYLGLRPNFTRYNVGINEDNARFLNKNTWVFGIEPHAGVNIKLGDHVTVRASAGWNFAQKKTVFQNYADPTLVIAQGISAKYSMKPCSFNFRVGVIYNF